MRRPYVCGNWKMNLDRAGARALASAVREHVAARTDVEVALFPPFVYLDGVRSALEGSRVRVGAQNCCDELEGAFTGEVSARMLRDLDVPIVLVGHSERRHVYGESNELVRRKVAVALEQGLEVMLCVGETLDERQAGRTEEVVRSQVATGLEGAGERLERVAIAYEPVWAIGTGLTATPEQAGAVHSYLRGVVAGLFGDPQAEALRILYGGSVKPDNARDLMQVADIDGALVGGASLKADSFARIVDFGK